MPLILLITCTCFDFFTQNIPTIVNITANCKDSNFVSSADSNSSLQTTASMTYRDGVHPEMPCFTNSSQGILLCFVQLACTPVQKLSTRIVVLRKFRAPEHSRVFLSIEVQAQPSEVQPICGICLLPVWYWCQPLICYYI